MPYKSEWFDAPKNMSVQVFKDLPENYIEEPRYFLNKSFRIAKTAKYSFAYFCNHKECKGWILELPNEYEENTIGILSGRKGTVFYCVRCGNEIGFEGMYS